MSYLTWRMNKSFSLIGVTKRAYYHLVPDKALPPYQIFASYPDTSSPSLSPFNIKPIFPAGRPDTILGLLHAPEFKKHLAQLHAKKRKIFVMVTNVTPEVETAVANLDANLIGSPAAARALFENKAKLRSLPALAKLCPPFVIAHKEELGHSEYDYSSLFQQFGPFVIQDASQDRTGGRGTFIIHSASDFNRGLPLLNQGGGSTAVISRYISGQPVSMLCCLTSHGLFHGPLQRQIIGEPSLTSPTTPQFAGGQWHDDLFTQEINNRADQLAGQIAEAMAQHNYRGLFGLDFMAGEDGRLYLTEINARPTALTFPLSLLQHAQNIPSLTMLHILEHARQQYDLPDPAEYQKALLKTNPLTYLVAYNLSDQPLSLKQTLPSGIFDIKSGAPQPVKASYDLSQLTAGQIIIPNFPAEGQLVKPNQQLLSFLSPDPILNPEGTLNPKGRQILTSIKNLFNQI